MKPKKETDEIERILNDEEPIFDDGGDLFDEVPQKKSGIFEKTKKKLFQRKIQNHTAEKKDEEHKIALTEEVEQSLDEKTEERLEEKFEDELEENNETEEEEFRKKTLLQKRIDAIKEPIVFIALISVIVLFVAGKIIEPLIILVFASLNYITKRINEENDTKYSLSELSAISIITALTALLILYAFNFFISAGAISGMALAAGMLLIASVPHTALISAKRIIFENSKEAGKGLRIKNQEEIITLGKITTLILETKGIATTGIQTAKKFFVDDFEFGVSGEGHELKGEFSNKPVDLHLLLKAGILTSNAKLDEEDKPVGNPIDSALIVSAAKLGLRKSLVEAEYVLRAKSREREENFSFVIVEHKGKKYAFYRGSPEEIMKRASFILNLGMKRMITGKIREKIMLKTEEYRNNSMTPVVFGMKEITDKDMHERKIEADLTIIGIQAVTDTPLKSIKHQIEHAEKSGIKMIIITAENYVNVKNFAKSLKLDGNVIEAMKLSKMDAREFRNAIKHASAISNAIPELKEKIVEKLRKGGEIVGIITNPEHDLLAMLKSNIAIATKDFKIIKKEDEEKRILNEHTGMVLKKNALAGVMNAVEYGRNANKIVKTQAGFSSAIVFAITLLILASLIIFKTPAISIIQAAILASVLPLAIVFSFAKEENSGQMALKPRPVNEKMLGASRIIYSMFNAILIAAAGIYIFYQNLHMGLSAAQINTAFSLALMITLLAHTNKKHEGLKACKNRMHNAVSLAVIIVSLAVLFFMKAGILSTIVPVAVAFVASEIVTSAIRLRQKEI